MKVWYELTPLDTLFFRGAEPLEAGMGMAPPLFPPPVSVILGAFRTAFLIQKGVSFEEYTKNRAADEIVSTIGHPGKDAPFSVTAILLKQGGKLYAPAPAHWFVDSERKLVRGDDYAGITVRTPSVKADIMKNLLIVSSPTTPPMVVAKKEARSLAGSWVGLELLGKGEVTLAKGDLLTAHDLYLTEPRIGIGLREGKTVEEGKLYTANHLRLREGVSILIGFDRHPGVAEKGMIQLGGEQRRSWYREVQSPVIPQVPSPSCFMNLAPLRAEDSLLTDVVATGKLQTTAGWDLSRGFHKPTVTWFPAGAVFRRNVNNSLIPITH